MEKICGIYKITSPTKKIYIGQSVDINRRFNAYKSINCKGQTHLYNSFLKHGVDNHKFELLHQCEPDKLNGLEKYYIELYQCFNSEHGLNLASGGDGTWRYSDETKRKMSIKLTGIKRSDEYKEQKRKTQTGKIPSTETKAKMSLSHIGLNTWSKGSILSDETKNKIRISMTGKYHGRKEKEVCQFSLDGVFIQKYKSEREAGRLTGISSKKINHNVLGNTKRAGGFIWKAFKQIN